MSDGLIDRNELDRKQDSALGPEEHLLVKPGDIAYNMMRMWQGAFGLADREGLVSPAYVVLKPKAGIEPEFAAQLLRTPRMLHRLWAYSHGLTDDRLRLYFSDFASIRVAVPPLHAQKQIAVALRTWDTAIGATLQMEATARQHRDALLEEVVSRGVPNAGDQEQYRVAKLGDIIESLDAGVSVNGLDRPARLGERGVLKISAVTSGAFDPGANKAIRSEDVDRAKVNPRAGRILVSRCNTAELLGASAYVGADHPDLFLPDKLWQLEPRPQPAIHMRWLAFWLAARSTRMRISALATGSSGSMKNIVKEQFLALTLAIPPYSTQVRIAEALQKWDAASSKYREQAQLLSLEKRCLAKKLLAGESNL